MPQMISKIAHNYAGRDLSPGEPFEADEEFVHTLELLGRAELAPIESRVFAYETRDMAVGAPAQYERRDQCVAATPHQKRKYNTKRKAS